MNCYFHVDQPAVAQCNVCGKGLCKECATKYDMVVCDDCVIAAETEVSAKEAAEQAKKNRRFKAALVVNVIAFIGMFILSFSMPIDDPEAGAFVNFIARVFVGVILGLIMGIELAGFTYAIGFVRKHVSLTGIFLIPFIGWGLVAAWFGIVLAIGVLIGPIQYLIDLIRKIVDLIKAKKVTQ